MKAFEVGVRGKDWTRPVQAESAGKAKYEYLRDIRESWPDVSFKHLTCHAIKSMPPTRTELAQREADAFNLAHPVGTVVRYWSGLKEGEPTGVGPINHLATVVCEHAVAWIEGARACHSLTHVERVA